MAVLVSQIHCCVSRHASSHLGPLIGQPFHNLWGSIKWTSAVRLKQRVPLEMIGEAKVSQLQTTEEENKSFHHKAKTDAEETGCINQNLLKYSTAVGIMEHLCKFKTLCVAAGLSY